MYRVVYFHRNVKNISELSREELKLVLTADLVLASNQRSEPVILKNRYGRRTYEEE